VRPTELVAAELIVRLPAIRRYDLSVSPAEKAPGDLAAPGGSDVEDRHKGRDDDPQPRLLPRLPPRRLINIGGLGADILFQLGHRLLQGLGGGPLQLGDHPRRDRQAEQVVGQLSDRTLAQAVATGQDGQ
jgi:hypothetical protein